MNHFSNLRQTLASALLTTIGTASAADLAFPPVQEKICFQGIVDKEMLSIYLIQMYPVSAPLLSQGAHPPGTSLPGRLSALLREAALTNKPPPKYDATDVTSLRRINGQLIGLLSGAHAKAYVPGRPVEPHQFLLGDNTQHQVACPTDPTKEKPADSPPASASGFRIRGKALDLNVDRAYQGIFKTTEQASLSIAHDHIADERKTKAAAFIGYAIPFGSGQNGNWKELVPYVGGTRNVDKEKGVVNQGTQEDKVNVGLLANIFVASAAGGEELLHRFTFGTDFQKNNIDDSRRASVNFDYTPIKNHVTGGGWWKAVGLNSAIRVKSLWVIPIASVRADAGHFTRRSATATEDEQRDFARLGAVLGVGLTAPDSAFPIEFSSRYTGMHKLRGAHSVSYFRHALTYSLQPDGYMGLTLSYLRGRQEDTSKKKEWTLEFTVRY